MSDEHPEPSGGATAEQRWVIRHPGEDRHIDCASFEEAMDKWFEGFNLPVLVTNGQPEPFEISNQRVKNYYANPSPVIPIGGTPIPSPSPAAALTAAREPKASA